MQRRPVLKGQLAMTHKTPPVLRFGLPLVLFVYAILYIWIYGRVGFG